MTARPVRSIVVFLLGAATVATMAAPGATAYGRSRGELFASRSRRNRPA